MYFEILEIVSTRSAKPLELSNSMLTRSVNWQKPTIARISESIAAETSPSNRCKPTNTSTGNLNASPLVAVRAPRPELQSATHLPVARPHALFITSVKIVKPAARMASLTDVLFMRSPIGMSTIMVTNVPGSSANELHTPFKLMVALLSSSAAATSLQASRVRNSDARVDNVLALWAAVSAALAVVSHFSEGGRFVKAL